MKHGRLKHSDTAFWRPIGRSVFVPRWVRINKEINIDDNEKIMWECISLHSPNHLFHAHEDELFTEEEYEAMEVIES